MASEPGTVVAVSSDSGHHFSKPNRDCIRLVEGLGVDGDAHMGATVRHLSRQSASPPKPNLRQVHLIAAELHDELAARSMPVSPGEMGENVTTRGIDLLALPAGTRLHLGDEAAVEVTGLRTPCTQLNRLHRGLMKACMDHDAMGRMIRRAGIMGVVLASGAVRPGDTIRVELPPLPHRPLGPV